MIEPIYSFYGNIDKNVKENLTKSIKAQEIYTALIEFLVDCGFLLLFYLIGDKELEQRSIVNSI